MLRAVAVFCLALFLLAAQVEAHTVPSMVVEAEFTPEREVVLLVNLDPRLFLSDQPTSLPPVPASWWFQQSETERADTLAKAAAYVDAQLQFRVGGSDFRGTWKVQPVDSTTVAPLAPASGEVHLLAEHRGPLLEMAGDFKLTVARTCGVATLLMNAMAGAEQRQPQLVFPGESSRSFVLPPLAASATKASEGGTSAKPAPPAPIPASASTNTAGKSPAAAQNPPIPRHSLMAHGLFAIAITAVLLGRFRNVAVVLVTFHLATLAAAWMTWQGWLPVALGGMPRNCWMLLGGTALALLLVRRIPPALLAMAALAGFLHGWGPWNLRLSQGVEQHLSGLFQREGWLVLVELVAAGLAIPAMRYLARRTSLGTYLATGD
jgi:hypothetical protein